MQSRSVAAVAVAGVVMAGCAIVGPEQSAPLTTDEAVAEVGGQCPEWGCGANSPAVLNLAGFHELSLVSGEGPGNRTMPDAEGFSITALAGRAQIARSGTTYALRVQDGRMMGDCAAPCTPLEHAALVGATIGLVNGPALSQIRIVDVRAMSYFVDPKATPNAVEAYTLVVDRPGQPTTNLCNNIALLESLLPSEGDYAPSDLMGMRIFEAIVFEGDRIDGTRKTMSPAADDRWFNIGCAGSALAKLRLSRNTLHSQLPPAPTDPLDVPWRRRQATLKLLTADYCGGGTALTVAGQHIAWQGSGMGFYSAPLDLEARWTEAGATCLGVPRLSRPTSSLGATTFPDIKYSITQACVAAGRTVPPDCADLHDYNFYGALRVSANR